jgi:peptidoglycan biosynthesis protein MviN/MurJ (putative lipid II flippase)
MGQTVTAFAFARQQGGRLLRVNVAALVINVIAGIVLIFAFGVWGAVLANVVGQLAAVLLLAFGELRIQRLTWWAYLGTIRIWLISLVTGGLAILATSWLVADRSQIAACIVSGLVGLALVVVLGRVFSAGLNDADARAMVEASPRRAQPAIRAVMRLFVHRREEATA